MKGFVVVSMLGVFATLGTAQTPETVTVAQPIQDNSFLIEEAYNQPTGVVQHVNTFSLDHQTDSWSYSFTQEWPLFSERHQLSYTVPFQKTEPASGKGFGDIVLNYRYQVPMDSRPTVAIAPRLSVLLPSGDASKNRGAGGPGMQVNLPVSVALPGSLVTHFNAGATYTPSVKDPLGGRASTTGYNAGQSLIWLFRPALNFMVELAWASTPEFLATGKLARAESLLFAPGVRGAINLSRGLQVVPGIAVPIGLGASRGERSVFFYLSFEHPFAKSGR